MGEATKQDTNTMAKSARRQPGRRWAPARAGGNDGRESLESAGVMGPDNLCVDCSGDLNRRTGRISKFRVIGLEEVLPDEGKLETPRRVPPDAKVTSAVGADGLVGQGAHEAIGEIGFKTPGQIKQGLGHDLVSGAGAIVRIYGAGVREAGVIFRSEVQIGVRGF